MSSYTPPPSQPRLPSLVCFLCCALLIFHLLFKPLCHPTCAHISPESHFVYFSLALPPRPNAGAQGPVALSRWMDRWICAWLWRQRAQMCPPGISNMHSKSPAELWLMCVALGESSTDVDCIEFGVKGLWAHRSLWIFTCFSTGGERNSCHF